MAGACLPVHGGTELKPAEDAKEIAAPVTSDAGFYAAAFGGAQFLTEYGDSHQTDTTPRGANIVTETKFHSRWGGTGGFKGGYRFESFALGGPMTLRLQPAVEAEALYIGDDTHLNNLSGANSSEHFTSNSFDFFMNGIVRFKNSSIVTPYIGVGVGFQYISIHEAFEVPLAHANATGLVGDDLDFAGQALLGFDIQVARHISIFTEYKFIDALGTDVKTGPLPPSLGRGETRVRPDQIQQNLITAGVKYEF